MIPDLIDLFPQWRVEPLGKSLVLSRGDKSFTINEDTEQVDFLHDIMPAVLTEWLQERYAKDYPYLHFTMSNYSEIKIYRSSPNGELYEFIASIVPGVLLDGMVIQVKVVFDKLQSMNNSCELIYTLYDESAVCSSCHDIVDIGVDSQSFFENNDLFYVCDDCLKKLGEDDDEPE